MSVRESDSPDAVLGQLRQAPSNPGEGSSLADMSWPSLPNNEATYQSLDSPNLPGFPSVLSAASDESCRAEVDLVEAICSSSVIVPQDVSLDTQASPAIRGSASSDKEPTALSIARSYIYHARYLLVCIAIGFFMASLYYDK